MVWAEERERPRAAPQVLGLESAEGWQGLALGWLEAARAGGPPEVQKGQDPGWGEWEGGLAPLGVELDGGTTLSRPSSGVGGSGSCLGLSARSALRRATDCWLMRRRQRHSPTSRTHWARLAFLVANLYGFAPGQVPISP